MRFLPIDVAIGLSDWNDGIGLCGVRRARGDAGQAERSAEAGRRVDADRGPRTPVRSGRRASVGGRIETTQEELAALEVIRRLPGPAQPVGYTDRPHKRL